MPRGLGLGIVMVLVAGGCHATGPAVLAPRDIAATLVLPGGVMAGGDAWPARESQREFSRNDDAVSLATVPPAASPEWVEFQTRDRLWVTNGRPREYSLSNTRSSRVSVTR